MSKVSKVIIDWLKISLKISKKMVKVKVFIRKNDNDDVDNEIKAKKTDYHQSRALIRYKNKIIHSFDTPYLGSCIKYVITMILDISVLSSKLKVCTNRSIG